MFDVEEERQVSSEEQYKGGQVGVDDVEQEPITEDYIELNTVVRALLPDRLINGLFDCYI